MDRRDRCAVSKGLLEFSGVDNVGKKQGQQPSAMFALKFSTFARRSIAIVAIPRPPRAPEYESQAL
jgi:hypothetical protein